MARPWEKSTDIAALLSVSPSRTTLLAPAVLRVICTDRVVTLPPITGLTPLAGRSVRLLSWMLTDSSIAAPLAISTVSPSATPSMQACNVPLHGAPPG